MESQNIEKYNQIEIFGNPRKHLVTVEELAEFISDEGGGGGDVNIDDVTGVTPVGLSVAKATTQAAARTAIGAGTSNLAIGTTATTALAGNTALLQIGSTATTAKAGNWTPPNVTTTANGLMIATDKVKLDAIAAQATKNDTDANLKNRANHTGTQAISTITGVVPIAQIPTGSTATTVALGNHSHTLATPTTNGFLSSADKAKLDSLIDNGGFTPVAAPTITITDPPDDENIQQAFDAIIQKLKDVGVFT